MSLYFYVNLIHSFLLKPWLLFREYIQFSKMQHNLSPKLLWQLKVNLNFRTQEILESQCMKVQFDISMAMNTHVSPMCVYFYVNLTSDI